MKNDKKAKKDNKTQIIQIRCTEKEVKKLDKLVSKRNIKRSEYVRERVFGKRDLKSSNIEFLVLAQDVVEYIEEICGKNDKKLEGMVEELWKVL